MKNLVVVLWIITVVMAGCRRRGGSAILDGGPDSPPDVPTDRPIDPPVDRPLPDVPTGCVTNADCRTTECHTGVCLPTGDCDFQPVLNCTPCGTGSFCSEGACVAPTMVYQENFEGAFPPVGFTTDGVAPWTLDVDGVVGTRAARSGNIPRDGITALRLTLNLSTDSTLSFWYKTSSETCCDRLHFAVDDMELDAWGGIEATWTEVSFPLSAGSHFLHWTYTKDLSVDSGLDAVWIDAIEITSGICGL